MIVSNKTKNVIDECIVLLHIVLFTYAAANKILDFVNFQIQLAQSPLLSSFAEWISYLVPALEIIISVALTIRKTRLAALYASFSLMVMFSTYIAIMVNFSPFVPCSCGGILEKMSWNQHLVFNIIFVVLGFIAIVLYPKNHERKYYRVPIAFSAGAIGTAAVAILFLTSEDMIHHRNNFTRRFPIHPATISEMIDLKVNSYYIAGEGNGSVYLGNYTAPLIVTVVDSTLKHKQQYHIEVTPARDSFYSLQLSIRMPYFYLADGRSPIVYRGIVGKWVAQVWTENTAYFNAFEPIDGHRAAFRAISSTTREHILGLFNVGETTAVVVNPLLDKQADGIFDTGGTLRYNEESKKLLYVYTYRNEYLVIDENLHSKKIQHTIDTTSKVRIKTRYDARSRERTLASPAWTVNNRARTHKKYLFVNSALMGQFEPEEMWERASVIDVYDFNQDRYEFSFYLTKIMDSKMSDFFAGDDKIYAICGNYLSVYRLDHDFYTRRW
jgi:hypothetical protein